MACLEAREKALEKENEELLADLAARVGVEWELWGCTACCRYGCGCGCSAPAPAPLRASMPMERPCVPVAAALFVVSAGSEMGRLSTSRALAAGPSSAVQDGMIVALQAALATGWPAGGPQGLLLQCLLAPPPTVSTQLERSVAQQEATPLQGGLWVRAAGAYLSAPLVPFSCCQCGSRCPFPCASAITGCCLQAPASNKSVSHTGVAQGVLVPPAPPHVACRSFMGSRVVEQFTPAGSCPQA